MLKKALKIAVSFCLLVGAYAGYTRLFALVVYELGVSEKEGPAFPEHESNSARRAAELARESFGPDSFAARDDLKLQYYEAARGFYMFAQNKKILNDGKTVHVWPFAVIWLSKDGKSRKVATSDEAIIDMSQPFMSVKQSTEPNKITHARMSGNVRMRDDKGTLDDRSDDLNVSTLGDVEFDDKTLQITTESDVFLQDRNLTLWGVGLMIQLRRKVGPPDPNGITNPEATSGFDAEKAFVYKDVHIIVNDVTRDGVLPGQAKAEKSGKVPIDVRSDREMQIDLPPPRLVDVVGPPNLDRPPDPTFVKFRTNVRVIRGTEKLDQLNSDTLDLTMLPDPRKPGDEYEDLYVFEDGKEGPLASDGPMSELKIRVALARGDAVWLQSEAQGMVARCVELKYEKHAFEGRPDITFLNGGTGKKLMVDKVDYDTKAASPGTIKSIMRLTALDATIFESGGAGTSSKVVARGPGTVKERPAHNASVTREVWFEDEMEMLTWHDGLDPTPVPSPLAVRSLAQERPAIARGTLRRLLTLTGVSKLVDLNTSTTLDARKSIVAEFQAEPNPPPLKGEGSAQIKWLDAYEDAHLTAPSKILTARVFLKAKFEQPPPPPKVVAPPVAPGVISAPAGGPIVAAAPAPAPAPKPEADSKPLQAEPLVDGRADRVWASVELAPTGDSGSDPNSKTKGELKNAQLRGGVMVHQDPKAGESYGSDASGEALDLTNQGNGLMKFVVKREDPQAFDPKTRLASNAKGRGISTFEPARASFKGKTIESEDIIGVDQKIDFAWSQGAGVFTQLADRGLLDDKGIDGEKPAATARGSAKPSGPTPKDKLEISWNREMRFYGRSTDLEGRAAAKVEFRGDSYIVQTADGKLEFRRGVEAKMTDSAIYTDTMDVYMDRTIDFAQDSKKPPAKPGEPAPEDPQIAMLDCKGGDIVEDAVIKNPGVDIISRKVYTEFEPHKGELKEKYRIQGQHVIYDKRTGNFHAFGHGTTYIYRRKGGDSKGEAPIPTVFPASSPSNGRTRPEVVLSDKKLPPLELTKIRFTLGMQGRFGVAKDKSENERRDAEFYGDVQAANASVLGKNSDIDFDHLTRWPDYVFLTSDVLDVFSIPLPPGSNPPNKQLLNARGNALARSHTDTIQADRITYNSASALTYAYGDDGKEVSITKQDSTGQRPTTTRGKTARYNNKTRESKIDDPQAMSFVDLKSGVRAKAFLPDLGGSPKPIDPKALPRTPLQRQGKVSTERNGFTGH